MIHTHQHKEITEKISRNFNLKKPDVFLTRRRDDIIKVSQVPLWYLKCILSGIFRRRKIWQYRRGICLLHGDTPSTLLGAIIAKIGRQKIAHVEAGLRSYSIRHPFPEEIIRRITTRMSDYLFAPSDWALNNLKREGVKGKVFNSKGNTVFDSIEYILKSKIKVDIPRRKYIIACMHRNETILIKERFKAALYAVEKSAEKFLVIFVLHKPTRRKLEEFGFYERIDKNPNIEIKPYYDYFSFMKLINDAEYIIADGGSIQEETYYLNKPFLILRERTERIYGLKSTAYLSLLESDKIDYFIDNYKKFAIKEKISKTSPSKSIVDILLQL